MPDGCAADGRRWIVTADDLGLRREYEDAIRDAHARGAVTSVAVVTNGESYESALEFLRSTPTLEVGIHLNVIEGRPLSPAGDMHGLVDRDGYFLGRTPAFFARLVAGLLPHGAIEREWERQILRAKEDGLSLLHVSSHHHLHMLPALFDATVRLARRHGIRFVRVTDEPPWTSLGAKSLVARAKTAALWVLGHRARRALRRASLDHPIACRGIAASGHLDAAAWSRIAGSDAEVLEVVCHPGQSREQDAALASITADPRRTARAATRFADLVHA